MRDCVRLATTIGLALVVGCTRTGETRRGVDSGDSSPPVPAASDAGAPVAVAGNPCRQDAEAGETATIPGVLVVEAPDGRSPTHGMSGANTARFRLGNVSDRALEVRASSLELRALGGDSDGGSATFAVASITVDGVNAAVIRVPPRACVEVALTADGAPAFRYHQRYAFVTTFSVDGRSVVARSGDKYFRYPRFPPKP